MNKQFEQVKEFQHKFGQPVSDKPRAMTEMRRLERYSYMSEEMAEFVYAITVTDQSDAMIDLIYLGIGTLVEMGVKPEDLFNIVHNANMSKLWDDGKPHFDEVTGKVIKPPNFVRPEPLLAEEIKRQAREEQIREDQALEMRRQYF